MNTSWKIIEKDNIYNPKILKDLNIYENYCDKWIVLIDEKSSPNYYEKGNKNNCCFTNKIFIKNWQSKIPWSSNCKIFIKCPNPYCNNWILYQYNSKYGFYKNIELVNNYYNCCNNCNKKYKLNPGICCICKKFNFSRDQNSRGRDSYKLKNYIKVTNKTGCSCSENWFYKHNNDPNFLKIVGKASSNRWKNPEYANKIAQNLGEYLGNPDWAIEIGIEGRKAIAFLLDNDKEYAKTAHERASKLGEIYGKITIYKAIEKQKEFWENNAEWAENQRKICAENGKKSIYFAQKAYIYLLENDKEFSNKMSEISKNNLEKAKEAQIQKFKKLFTENPIKLNDKIIYYDDLKKLKQNDICGSWIIRAKFKDYKGTNRENERFRLGLFKAKEVYDEMSWAGRVIKQPGKQDWIITPKNPWTDAKWWYISNLYYDFEFELITDENGVTEEEALVAEAAYASKYNLFVKFTTNEEGRRIPIIEKHAYWSP